MPALWNYSTSVADKVGYKESEITVSIIFMLLMNTFNGVISLPFAVYSVFVIEEKHGFNKQVKSSNKDRRTILWNTQTYFVL